MARRIDPRLRGYRWSDSVVAQGIRSLDDLAALSEDEILGIHGVGPARLAEIIDVLWENDLELVASEPAEDDNDVDIADDVQEDAAGAGGAVLDAAHTYVRTLASSPAEKVFAAIAERLARDLDDSGNPYVARELRMVIGVLDRQPAASASPDGPAPDVEDEVAKARRERQSR